MKHKVLIVSVYPAPYRMELFARFTELYDTDVFFEHSGGDERNKNWFSSGNYFTLDSEEGRIRFKDISLNNYDFVVLYDYTEQAARHLISKCRKKKIPYILNCDGVMLSPHGNPLKDIYKRFLISGAAAYLASGEHAKKYFMSFGADEKKIHLHPFSALVPDDFVDAPLSGAEKLTLRKKLGLPETQKIAVGVGRFIPLKRYAELIEAWADMPPSCTLLLIGGGREEEHYRAVIREKGLENVILEPFHPAAELREYYRAADIFVHPTSYDVWGLVVNEAMASGLPVVVSDHCVAGRELIKDGENGYKTPMGDEAALCRRAKELLEASEDLRASMGKEALETIKPYTLENMASAQLAAFESI